MLRAWPGALMGPLALLCLVRGGMGQERVEVKITAVTVTKLLGKPIASEDVKAFSKSLGAEPKVLEGFGRIEWAWYEHGISLSFDKDKKVTTVHLYNKGEKYQTYKGEVPLGLRIIDTLPDVEKKLGKPDNLPLAEYLGTWLARYSKKGIGVTYRANGEPKMPKIIDAIHVFVPVE